MAEGLLDTCAVKAVCRKRAKGLGCTFRNRQNEGAYGCCSSNIEAFWDGDTNTEKFTQLLIRNRGRSECLFGKKCKRWQDM